MQPPTFMMKEVVKKADAYTNDGYGVRVSLSTERVSPPPVRGDMIELVREKTRWSYVYKNEFSFDLTTTLSGATHDTIDYDNPQYEVRFAYRSPQLLARCSLLK
ncbi:MAG: hypothetical protein EOO65_03085 [Methanosarcinales archaeon]|nr:MAG: hypothetical protein EOO65_03085 [Methanosarcinales archaeon]